MHKAKWEAEYLGSWPCFTTESLSKLEQVFLSSFCSSTSLSVKKRSKSEEGDETTEAEVGVTCFEDEGRGHEPRSVGSL